jgi:hypothetical protein
VNNQAEQNEEVVARRARSKGSSCLVRTATKPTAGRNVKVEVLYCMREWCDEEEEREEWEGEIACMRSEIGVIRHCAQGIAGHSKYHRISQASEDWPRGLRRRKAGSGTRHRKERCDS